MTSGGGNPITRITADRGYTQSPVFAQRGNGGDPGHSQPRACSSSLALLAEAEEALLVLGPALDHVSEATERPMATDRDREEIGTVRVVEAGNEVLHVPVAVPRALGADVEPAIRIVGLWQVLAPSSA